MKLITTIEATLDLKSILSKTSGTITRHITLFVGADHPEMNRIMQAVRDARDLLRNDADMTMRLIKVRPEKAEEYKEAWATAAEKQMLNVYSVIKEAFGNEKTPDGKPRELTFTHEGEKMIAASEIDEWTTPAPKQEEHPGAPLIPDEMPPKDVKPADEFKDDEPEPEIEAVPEVVSDPEPVIV